MIAHLLKLAWRRKRANALVLAEIFLSFVVVFAVAVAAVALASHARQPLGFDWRDVWNVQIDVQQTTDDAWDAGQVAAFARLLDEVRGLPEVVAVAGALNVPYDLSARSGTWEVEGRDISVAFSEVTDDFAAVLGLEIVAGRWFSAEDDGRDWKPWVIDLELARAMFGRDDPIGERAPVGDKDLRVVGVVTDYRKNGELAGASNFCFERVRLGDPSSRPPRNLVVKLRPGVEARFEEQLTRRLAALAPSWSFEVRSLESLRERSLRLRLLPVVIGGIVAGFLLVMVGLGLVGVLWQNVTQRTAEIGLRRATGATAGDVQRQILCEILGLAGLAMAAASMLLLQLPLLEWTAGLFSPWVFLSGLLVSIVVVSSITLASGLYPSRLATLIQPAAALHHE